MDKNVLFFVYIKIILYLCVQIDILWKKMLFPCWIVLLTT